jgi:alpha-galactosidase
MDAMRISADVDGRWEPTILGKDIPAFYNEPGLPAARNVIQNTLTRSALHRRWWLNDPDCLLLREDTQLTKDEMQSLATVIALSGGLWALSDNLPELSDDRIKIAQSLLPPIGQRPEVMDWFDASMPQHVRLDLSSSGEHWQLVALFNWQDRHQTLNFSLEDYRIPADGKYWLRDFWQNETYRLAANETIRLDIAPHGVRLFAVRTENNLSPVYLGSNLHVSQGLELKRKTWQPAEGSLDLYIERPGKATGIIELNLPAAPLSASLDERQIEWKSTPNGTVQFSLEFEMQAHIHILLAKNSMPEA